MVFIEFLRVIHQRIKTFLDTYVISFSHSASCRIVVFRCKKKVQKGVALSFMQAYILWIVMCRKFVKCKWNMHRDGYINILKEECKTAHFEVVLFTKTCAHSYKVFSFNGQSHAVCMVVCFKTLFVCCKFKLKCITSLFFSFKMLWSGLWPVLLKL